MGAHQQAPLADLFAAVQQFARSNYGAKAVAVTIEVEGLPIHVQLPIRDAPAPGMTDREAAVLETVGREESPGAEDLAARVGEECTPAFRSMLSGMRKRGLLGGAIGSVGYPRGQNAPA